MYEKLGKGNLMIIREQTAVRRPLISQLQMGSQGLRLSSHAFGSA